MFYVLPLLCKCFNVRNAALVQRARGTAAKGVTHVFSPCLSLLARRSTMHYASCTLLVALCAICVFAQNEPKPDNTSAWNYTDACPGALMGAESGCERLGHRGAAA